MRTRAIEFRDEEMRKRRVARARPAQPKRPRRDDPVDTARPTVSATDRKAGGDLVGLRNVRSHAGRRGGAVLEENRGKPARKSTRKSVDRTRRTTNQQLRAVIQTASPPARQARGQARTTRTRARGGR
jgi:hypothetical protein